MEKVVKKIEQEVLQTTGSREKFLSEMKQRQKQGLVIAKKCASFLKQKYVVEKVVLFGSLLDYQKMTPHSD